MFLSAYTISRQPVHWPLSIHWLNNSTKINPDVYNPLEYVAAIAAKRNETVDQLLAKYPETTHILCCDSYYVSQVGALKRLVQDTYRLRPDCILGGGVWGPWRQRISDFGKCNLQWADRWSVKLPCYHKLRDQTIIPAPAVSGIHIFPRTVWNRTRYQAYQDSEQGTEITWLCQHSDRSSFIDLAAFFYRERKYSILKCFQCSLALRTRLGKMLA